MFTNLITKWKQDIKKKWNRVIETKYTIYFALVSIIQAVVLMYLQYRILERNGEGLINMLKLKEASQLSQNCFDKQFLALYVLTLENLMFIIFYFFQIYFCFNAIFHQNTIQIITIASINCGFVFIGIMQLFEVKSITTRLEEDCQEFEFFPEYINNEIFFIFILALLATLMGYLSYKLFRQFGWSIYKKISGDISMQRLYKRKLIFVMLLKLDLLMMILFSGLLIPVFYLKYSEQNFFEKFLIFSSVVIMIMSISFEYLAYKSVNEEWKLGMFLFIMFWIFALINFAGLCIVVISLSVETKWYIGFIIGITCFSFALSTLAYAILIRGNFGRGLKEYLSRNKDVEDKTVKDYDNYEKGKGIKEKFLIDD